MATTNYILSGEESVKQILSKGNSKLYGIDKSVITQIQNDINTLKNKSFTHHLVWERANNTFTSDYGGQCFKVNFKNTINSNFTISLNRQITKMVAPTTAYTRANVFANVQVQEDMATIQGKIDNFTVAKDTMVCVDFNYGTVSNISIPEYDLIFSYTATDGQAYKYQFYGYNGFVWNYNSMGEQIPINTNHFIKFIPAGYVFEYTPHTKTSALDLAVIDSVNYLKIYFYIEINRYNVRFTQTPNNLYELNLDFTNLTADNNHQAYIQRHTGLAR